MRRRTAAVTSTAAVLAGCAVAVGVPLAWSARSHDAAPDASIGSGIATRLAGQPPVRSRPSGTLSPAPATSPAAQALAPAGNDSHGAPVQLSLASAGIAAPVVPVGVDRSGAVAIPARVDTVGWYRWGAAPGADSGSIVLVGHVDSAEQGTGAFFRLHTVRRGDRVTVTTRDRHRFGYRVVAREEFPKTTVPLGDLFSRDGRPRLTLITCGGSFDARAGSYRDNVVVTAVPTGAVS